MEKNHVIFIEIMNPTKKRAGGGVKSADKMDIDQMHIDVIIVRRI